MIPANELGRTMVAAGLVSADEVKAAWSELPADQKTQGATALAASLLSAGKLTPYQSEELLAGRGKSLLLGNYLVLDRIGAGGMGQVFRARHRRMERLVAIKLLPPAFSQDEAMIKRFQREVHAAAKLTHPNIVVAYDADQTPDGVHFLVMEYVDGCDLAALVKRQGPLAVSVAADYVLQAARGLAFAHAEGVIHRDIKPANLLLDKKGTVKILDMGLARLDGASVEGEGLTQSGQVMGTIDYMAPEQALNTRLADARADIYSLGCTLYRLLVGESPYGGETMMEKLLAHREQPIPSLRSRRQDVPAPLEAIYQKMMAKEASDRYQTMTEVTTALERWRGAEPSRPAPSGKGGVADPDSKLSAFMQTMSIQTATKKAVRGAKPKASAGGGIDATVSFQSAEVGTDPKSQMTSPQAMEAGRANGPSRRPNRRLLAAGGGALALVVLLGVWLVVRDKDGKETGRIELPDGGSMSLENGGAGKTKSKTKTPTPRPPNSSTPPPLAVAPFTAVEAKQHQSAWAAHLGVEVTEANSLGMKMTLIPPGEFLMGTSDEELAVALKIAEEVKLDDNVVLRIQELERPQHRVRLTQAFRLCAHEVTIGQFAKFVEQSGYKTQAEEFGGNSSAEKLDDKTSPPQMDKNWRTPGYAVADDSPVTQVTWNDAVVFCNWLSEQEKFSPCYRRDGNTWTLIPKTAGYRLPTEAEWEYACRAGTTTQYWFGDDWRELENYGWSNKNAGNRARAVGLLPGNAWDLHDMSGNVWEWCHDWYDGKFYGRSSETDPVGPSSSSSRVDRGGGWHNTPADGRSAYRGSYHPAHRHDNRGFRPALSSVGAKPSK